MFILIGECILDLMDDDIEGLYNSFDVRHLIYYLDNSFTEITTARQARLDIPRMKIMVNGRRVFRLRDLDRYRDNPNYQLLLQCCTQALISYPYVLYASKLPNPIIEYTTPHRAVIRINIRGDDFKCSLVKHMRVMGTDDVYCRDASPAAYGDDVYTDASVYELFKIKIKLSFDLKKQDGCMSCRNTTPFNQYEVLY